MATAAPNSSSLEGLVANAAYALLAEGLSPTVRAVRAKVRASNNEVAAALAAWRRELQVAVKTGWIDQGIPPEVAEYVRLGISAAQGLATPPRSESDAERERRAAQQTIAALEAHLLVLQRQCRQLKEQTGRLEADLDAARTRAATAAVRQRALDLAEQQVGRLSAELRHSQVALAEANALAGQAQQAVAAARAEVDRLAAELSASKVDLALARALAARVPGLGQELEQARRELEALKLEIAQARSARPGTPRRVRGSSVGKKRAPSPRRAATTGARRAKVAGGARTARQPKPPAAKRVKHAAPPRVKRRGTPSRASRGK